MVDLCAATYRSECKTVDFLVGLERITSELYTYIAQYTRIVGVVVAAVLCARAALNLYFALIVLCLTAEDDATPVARTAVAFSLF